MKLKSLFFFLFAGILLCSCSCLLSQIPPQNIYAGSGCTAIVPDYTPYVHATGGCSGVTVTQTPVPGTVLTSVVVNKAQPLIFKATGGNGKIKQRQTTITMLDTITPQFGAFTGPLALEQIDTLMLKIGALYNIADDMTERLYKEADKVYPYDLYPGSGPSTQGEYDSSLYVTVSMKDLTSPGKEWKRVSSLATHVSINPDTTIQYVSDPIDFRRIVNSPMQINETTGKLEFLWNSTWHTVTSN